MCENLLPRLFKEKQYERYFDYIKNATKSSPTINLAVSIVPTGMKIMKVVMSFAFTKIKWNIFKTLEPNKVPQKVNLKEISY